MRRLYPPLTDLIDSLTIDQIKEVLRPEEERESYAREMQWLARDIDDILQERQMSPSGSLVRLIIILAQANLHVWFNKERMQTESGKYLDLLKWAQEMNGLRNHVRNLLMEEFGEGNPANRRSTFLEGNGSEWYQPLLQSLEQPKNDSAGLENLGLEEFARLLGIRVEDLPSDCRKIIATNDFRYRILDAVARERVLLNILKRIHSEDAWVSGPSKQHIWERGWSENLREYEGRRDVRALTPKFIRPNQAVRLNQNYVEPLESNFEFNVVDVYRRWLFRKYLRDVRSVYEFGCGSCQHLPVLVELFPNKAIHGLDWAVASLEIIEALVRDKGWNLEGHLFDLYYPDESFNLEHSSGVVTVGTMEQLGKNFEPFLQFLIRKRPGVVIHMETVAELYDIECLMDYLAVLHDRKRQYLDGYLSRLRQLEKEEKLEIVKAHRVRFGNLFHDSYSLIVWRPR